MSEIKIFNLDDLVVDPVIAKKSKVFQKAVLKKDYEVIIPDDESDILVRDLEKVMTNRQATRLVQIYLSQNKKGDYLAQSHFLNQYLKNQKYTLPWLLPIVVDQKYVYKKKNISEQTIYLENKEYNNLLKQYLNYNNIQNSQKVIQALHNYVTEAPNSTNHSGSQVIRLRLPIDENTTNTDKNYYQMRGSYGDMKIMKLIEQMKSARKTVIIGKTELDKVIGEPLKVVGFVKFSPHDPKKPENILDWFKNGQFSINPNNLEQVLKDFLPNVGQILETYNTIGVTDLRAFLKVFALYGHDFQSLTETNRKQISEIIMSNLSLYEPIGYKKMDRLYFPHLEKQLVGERGSKILTNEVLEQLIPYRIPFENFPGLFSKYNQIIRRLDNGQIWFKIISFMQSHYNSGSIGSNNSNSGSNNSNSGSNNSNSGSNNSNSKSKKTIPNKKEQAEEVRLTILRYQILMQFREIYNDLRKSYYNYLKNTPVDRSLLENWTENPIDNIREIRPDKRLQIAWTHYFQKAFPDRQQKNYFFRGQWIGCQHEYDFLYKKFEDPDDQFPLGKRYTRLTPHGGVNCGFCGDVLEEESEMINQGYDARGQRINTYDNDSLIKSPSNIDLFLQKSKTDVVSQGEKMVEQWLNLSGKNLNKRQVKAFKFKILKDYEEGIIGNHFYEGLQQDPNKMMKVANREFGMYFVQKFNLDETSYTSKIFLPKIFQFFYSILASYEIIIQRLAIFLVYLNWQLIREDPGYLNPNLLLNHYNLTEIGNAFFKYNLANRAMFTALKDNKKIDTFQQLFRDRTKIVFAKQKQEMSAINFKKFVNAEYANGRLNYLYIPGQKGNVFNGDNPLEHEIMIIVSDYFATIGKTNIRDYLVQNFMKYWQNWLNGHKKELSLIQQNMTIGSIMSDRVMTPVDPTKHLIEYCRFLGQRNLLLREKLQQLYLDLVNDNIYNLRSKNSDGSSIDNSQLITNKMYYLNKLGCDDWTNLEDLNFIGLESETVRLDVIYQTREEIRKIREQMIELNIIILPKLRYTGGILFYPYGESKDVKRNQTIYHTEYKPVDLVGKKLGTLKGGKVKFEIIKDGSEKTSRFSSSKMLMNQNLGEWMRIFFNESNLTNQPKYEKMLKGLGRIHYLFDLKKQNVHTLRIINRKINEMSECNSDNVSNDMDKSKQMAINEEEFVKMADEAVNSKYKSQKMQLFNLKKYIITYLRNTIEILSRMTNREEMTYYNLSEFLDLFEYSDFNNTFVDFNKSNSNDETDKIITNEQIELLVQEGIDVPERRGEIIDLLQSIFISDILRHFRLVTSKSGRFTKNKVNVKGELSMKEIFVRFIKIIFRKIYNNEQVMNVNFNHLEINRIFINRSFWKMLDSAERKGELDYKIAKSKINTDEFIVEASLQTEADDQTDDQEDDGSGDILEEEYFPETDNDVDDYNDNDFDNL